jgi:hypothetical protein
LAAYGDGRVVSEALICITLDFNFFAFFSVLWLASPSLGLAARPEWSIDDANLGFFFQIPTKGSHIRNGGKQIRKFS